MGPGNRTAASATAAGLVLILVLGGGGGRLRAASDAGQVPSASPASATDQTAPLTLKEAGREFLDDAGRIWSSPARIRGKDVLPLLGFAAATTLFIAADESTRSHVHAYADQHAWVGDVSSVVTQMGGWGGFAAAGAFFGAGLIFKDARARDTGYLAASAILQSTLVYTVAKGLTGRQRPFVADGQDHWTGPSAFFRSFDRSQSDRYSSFPSGHSAAAFSLATVVALQYRHTVWVPVLAYTIAGTVGLSRITLDRHWASDVFVGALVGHFVGRLVVRNHERRRRFVPMAACTGRGLVVSLSYDLDPAGY